MPSGDSDLAFLRTLAETRSFTNGAPQSVTLTPDGSCALYLRGLPRKAELLPQVGQTHMFSQPDLQVRYWERVFAFFRAHL